MGDAADAIRVVEKVAAMGKVEHSEEKGVLRRRGCLG